MADAGAKRLRRQQGKPRRAAIRRRVDSHSSNGGSRGYSVEHRQRELELVDQGIEPAASWASIYRWRDRLQPPAKRQKPNPAISPGPKIPPFNKDPLDTPVPRDYSGKASPSMINAYIANYDQTYRR